MECEAAEVTQWNDAWIAMTPRTASDSARTPLWLAARCMALTTMSIASSSKWLVEMPLRVNSSRTHSTTFLSPADIKRIVPR